MNACTSVCQQEKRLLKQTLREWEDDARTHRDLYAQARRQLTKGGWTPSRKAVEAATVAYEGKLFMAYQPTSRVEARRKGMRRALLAAWRTDHPTKKVLVLKGLYAKGSGRSGRVVTDGGGEMSEYKTHQPTCVARQAKLQEATERGYLGHEQDCLKGRGSLTCTCGVMKWLPEAVGILHTCECPQEEPTSSSPRGNRQQGSLGTGRGASSPRHRAATLT